MALIDDVLMLADGVALTASGIVGASVNFGYSDVGSGKKLKLVLISNTDGTGATASNSFYYEVRTADAVAGLAAGTVLGRSDVIAGEAHDAGKVVWEFTLPGGGLCKSRIALYGVEAGTAAVNLTALIVGEDWQNGMGHRAAISAAS